MVTSASNRIRVAMFLISYSNAAGSILKSHPERVFDFDVHMFW